MGQDPSVGLRRESFTFLDQVREWLADLGLDPDVLSARHRKMTQGLLDLKRLYWNLRRFRVGPCKDQTPYGLLGLELPDLSFWEFLKLMPEELRERLSAQNDAP